MSYLQRIQACHHYERRDFLAFTIDNEIFGLTSPSFAAELLRWSDVFSQQDQQLLLNPNLTTFEQRSEAVAVVMAQLYQEGVISSWVDEPYAVAHAFGDTPKMTVERAAASYLGTRCCGIHINGLVQKQDGIYIWVAVRAKDKPFWSGKLDQIVAGGQGIGISLMENVIKESAEEADIPATLACKAQARGALHYCSQSHRGISIDTLFNYDLWLPEAFTPVNTDGEVDEFILMRLDEMAMLVDTTDQFKSNCNLVNIDLLIRSGVITEQHPDFKAITHLLYAPAISL
ncbi:MAG: DUF4743 domain-containing protein [Cocleimonas sp.]|nr:DUF4743 domain-containing protein [Cocleimonas sp.]